MAQRFQFRTEVAPPAPCFLGLPVARGLLSAWVMRSEGCPRARSDAELAFIVMRALAAARLFWARGGALPLEALPAVVQAAPREIALAVAMLCDEGIVEVAATDATVRLTDRAAWEIAAAWHRIEPASRLLN